MRFIGKKQERDPKHKEISHSRSKKGCDYVKTMEPSPLPHMTHNSDCGVCGHSGRNIMLEYGELLNGSLGIWQTHNMLLTAKTEIKMVLELCVRMDYGWKQRPFEALNACEVLHPLASA